MKNGNWFLNCEKGSKIMILWPNYQGKNQKNDLL